MEKSSFKEIKDYIENLYSQETKFIELYNFAIKNNIPIIKKDVRQFLQSILLLKKPKKILEIGTAVGYSSLIMKDTIKDAKITTIDVNSRYSKIARRYYKYYGYEDIIQINEDALIALSNMKDHYDFVFIDAAKGHYQEYFNIIDPFVKPGGVIICDDVLYKGMVCNDNMRKKRHRHITIVKRLHEFLKHLMGRKDYHTIILPIDDGVSLSLKLK